MAMLHESWSPPEAYPAVIEETIGSLSVVYLPDFASAVSVETATLEADVRKTVGHLLRQRVVSRRVVPFASKPSTLEGNVIMVSTEGWSEIKEEEVADD